MAGIDAGTLLPNERVRRRALDGEVTQLHRRHRYAGEGDTFAVEGTTFEVTAVERRRPGDLTDEDARAEGSADLEAYGERLERVHEGFERDDDVTVARHAFERRE